MFTIFNMDQLPTIWSRDIRNDKVFHCLVFRIIIIVSTSCQSYANTPVDFAVSTVDALDDMVGYQNVAIIDCYIPFNGVAL